MRKLNFTWIAVLVATVMAAAQDAGLYLNFSDDGAGNGVVSQSVEMCDLCTTSRQITNGSVSHELNDILSTLWSGKTAGSGTLTFKSDIDFQEIGENGECVTQHEPIKIRNKVSIEGNGYTFKNVCYKKTIDYTDRTTLMSGHVGVFDTLFNATVSNIRIENVDIEISANDTDDIPSDALKYYYGVGALVGHVDSSDISGITLKNVRVSSLVVGGVAGIAQRVNFDGITSEDMLDISNTILMERNTGAVKGTNRSGRYYACVGGLVGYGLNLSAKDVDISAELNSSKGAFVAMGGLVGQMFMDSRRSNKVLNFHNVNVGAGSSIKGGAAMGGLFGGFFPSETSYGLESSFDKVSFDGSISNSSAISDSVYIGGLIARSYQIIRPLKISESFVKLSVDDTRSSKAIYYNAGGLVGGMGGNEKAVDTTGYLSIYNTKVDGKIKVVDKNANSSSNKGYVAMGGVAGVGYLAATEKAFANNTVRVSMDAALNLSEADSLDMGGFFGYVGMRDESNAGLRLKSSAYYGFIKVTGVNNGNYVGGAVGEFRKGESGNHIVFDRIKLSAENATSLISINADDDASMKRTGYVGGVCGYCRSPSMDRVAVHGDIDVLGNVDNVDALYVGGFLAYISTGAPDRDFYITNSYLKGTIHVSTPATTEHPFYVGYMGGMLSLNNSTAAHTIMSNYHLGSDAYDAFGSFVSVTMKSWLASVKSCSGVEKVFCWDIQYNVRNGSNNLDENENGTLAASDMKSSLLTTLNMPYRLGKVDEKIWTIDETGVTNEGYPYWIGEPEGDVPVVLEPGSSSSKDLESSSSEEVVESSSSAEPESSSEAEPESSSEVEQSSSSEEPESSSSVEIVESSSSAEPESSSEAEPESSSEVEQSSSSEEPESSSSKEPESSSSVEIVESSSSVAEPESSSAVEPESSSSEVEESSSSVIEVVEVSSSSEPLVWRAGAWNMVSLKALKKHQIIPTKGDYLYWWDESATIGDFWQYQAYGFKGDENDVTGYWYQSTKDIVINGNDPIPEGAEIVWEVDSINSGWNMVANPYGQAIDLSCDELKDVAIWRRNAEGTDYDPEVKVLGPYEGAWIKVNSPRTIRFSAKPVAAKKALQKANFAEAEGWSLKAVLSDDYGRVDSWNVMGVASREQKMEEPPAGMGGYVRLSIVEDNVLLAKSLKSESDEMSWTVRLSASNNHEGTLQLEGVEKVRALGKKVFVSVDGRTTEMTEGKSIKVALKTSSKTATVTVTSGNKPVVASNAIRNIRGIRSAEGLNVNFDVNSDLMGQTARVDVVSVSGKVVATAKFNANAGANSVNLNVKDRGLYIVSVRVGSQSSVKNIAVR
ncbi:T9SS type A sorting domain-containing protein [Fibrobacter sp. UWH6]|uniref:T9SS type A sorting domain-containing protein n=1 Tax=Fibrobacter sp. (strain UWH6) TaxID=1896212 RepID=UPI00092220C2|nr:T9SS type A sorting domain-containing protein [Fibrobacter sp. UWH6]SHK16755.1 Por secretion system C-terminal sorting domain-containing protein [Fibrobacter sp. UWH6]